jgi:hypothetical protein
LFLPGHGTKIGIVFNIGDRDRVRDRVLDMASLDPRVVAGAVLGSLAHDEGDRWSDLDLMFAVADDVPVTEVLEAWSQTVVREFGAVHLFDLPSGPIIYRVFLLPGCLELDLSFTPASEFSVGGPKFRLLFGEVVSRPEEPPISAHELFGYAVHHTLHARVSLLRVLDAEVKAAPEKPIGIVVGIEARAVERVRVVGPCEGAEASALGPVLDAGRRCPDQVVALLDPGVPGEPGCPAPHSTSSCRRARIGATISSPTWRARWTTGTGDE